MEPSFAQLEVQPGDSGFTLIELLVVMILIGVLAAISVPLFLSQRAKAHDSATKADVSNLGKEIATYFIEPRGPLSLSVSGPHQIDLVAGSYATYARLTVGSTLPPTGGYANLNDPTGWCVALMDPQGSKTFKYTAVDGLGEGSCP